MKKRAAIKALLIFVAVAMLAIARFVGEYLYLQYLLENN